MKKTLHISTLSLFIFLFLQPLTTLGNSDSTRMIQSNKKSNQASEVLKPTQRNTQLTQR